MFHNQNELEEKMVKLAKQLEEDYDFHAQRTSTGCSCITLDFEKVDCVLTTVEENRKESTA